MITEFKKIIEDNRLKIVILVGMFFGILVHGQMIFNKLMYHDEIIVLNGNKADISLGRWALFGINRFLGIIFDNTSTSTFGVTISLFFIVLTAYVIANLYEIKNKFELWILSILSVVNLYVCCSNGYLAYAMYFSFSFLLTAIACFILLKCEDDKFSLLLSSIIFAMAVGIYQSNIILYITILLGYYILNISKFDLKKLLRAIIPCIISLIVYLILYKLYFLLKNATPSDYKNISNFGFTDLQSYLERIKFAVINFFFPENMKNYTMYPHTSRFAYSVIVILYYLNAIIYYKNKSIKLNSLQRIFLIIFIVATPFVFNGIFIIAGAENVYVMNLFNYILLFFILFALINSNSFNKKIIGISSFILSIFILLSLYKYTDACYNNLFLKMEQETSFGLQLISKIENIDGYSDEYKICFIENADPYFHRHDNNFAEDVTYNDILMTPPYAQITDGETTVYNSYTDYKYQEIINGFKPKTIQYKDFGHEEEIKQMPIYPKAGSIKIIDNVIVVKMQDVYSLQEAH